MKREVTLAENAGFCFGVKRAVDEAIKIQQEVGTRIYTLGPLIHNNDVVKFLEDHDIFAVDFKDLDSLDEGSVIEVKLIQPSKHFSSNEVTDAGIVTEVKLRQP